MISYDRIQLITTRTTSPFAPRTSPGTINGAAARTILRQYVSEPLNAQTISGTMKGIVRAASFTTWGFGSRYPLAAYLTVRVVSRDGQTTRGTLYALQADGTPTATFASTYTDRKVPSGWTGAGVTLSSVTAQQGDRLAIEFGAGRSGAGGSGYYTTRCGFDFGVGADDLPEDETGTAQKSPWVEFSANITWEGAGGGVIDPGNPPANVSTANPADPPVAHRWNVYLCDRNGNRLSRIDQLFTDAEITVARNAAATLKATMPADDPALTTVHTDGDPFLFERSRTIKAYRDDGPSAEQPRNLRFNGTVMATSFDLGEAAKVTLLAADPLAELVDRKCRDTSGNLGIGFSQTLGGEVVRLLIDNANIVSPTGLQVVQVPTMNARDVVYEGTKDIASALSELAQSADGFDYWAAPVDHTDGIRARLLMYAKPGGIGNDRPNIVVGWQRPPHNLPGSNVVRDGSRLCNTAVIPVGDGTYVVRTDSGSQTKYGYVEKDVGNQNSGDVPYLQGLGDAALRPDPLLFIGSIEVAPVGNLMPEAWTWFFVGDTIRVDVPSQFGGKLSMVVESFTVSIVDQEKITGMTARQP